MIKTEIGYTTTHTITVRGKDLAKELIGQIDFVDMMMLVIMGRKCQGNEKEMVNAILVTATDHGLTPSAIVARLTHLGAPEALQGSVAAGLLGAGSVFLGAQENAAEMLLDAARELPQTPSERQLQERAVALVAARRAARQPLYGFGHNIHIEGDPRIPTLRAVSERNGYFGKHWKLLLAIEVAAESAYKRRLVTNAAGAVAAMISDMKLPAKLSRGLTLIGRCAGLVGHVMEEAASPTGQELWDLVLRQDPRNAISKWST